MAKRKCVRQAIVDLSDSDDGEAGDDCVIVESTQVATPKKNNHCNSVEPSSHLSSYGVAKDLWRSPTVHTREPPKKSNDKLTKKSVDVKRETQTVGLNKEKVNKRGRKRKILETEDKKGSCFLRDNESGSEADSELESGRVNNVQRNSKTTGAGGTPQQKSQKHGQVAGGSQKRFRRAYKQDDGTDSKVQEGLPSAKPKEHDTVETYMARLGASNVRCVEWSIADYIGEKNHIDRQATLNLMKLFDDDNTIPFIARYRKDMTRGMNADELRRAKNSYDKAKLIKARAVSLIKEIDKQGKWTPEFHAFVHGKKSLKDLDQIHSMFKVTKSTLAEKAKQIGLGPVAEATIMGRSIYPLALLVKPKVEGLKNEDQVRSGIVCIIADMINKDPRTFEKVKRLRSEQSMQIQTMKAKETGNNKDKTDKQKGKESKYDLYHNFSSAETQMKPHQILAINRGEARKMLSVKINVPNTFENSIMNHCLVQYGYAINVSALHRSLITAAIELAYNKSIKPSVKRRTRQDLNERAEVASMDVFVENVKQLLLLPPVRGKVVVGVDPGFRHGCKLAVVSEQGDVLGTEVIYPHDSNKPNAKYEAEKTLVRLVLQHKCNIFALGNGTACRETEVFLTTLIKKGAFEQLDMVYTIVDETGASIYSCSPEAASEFPNLNVNLISAVSIARRLQDPMAELVKIEPRHLGVGMYQHDLPEKQLAAKLNEVIMEAVSFVGVDVNTASVSLLKRVAGLSESKAKNIIEWRKSLGPFRTRSDLNKVKGIGNKSFEQCAGFIRIIPETAAGNARKKARQEPFDYLDQTWIHPESYDIARNLLKAADCNIIDIGKEQFIFDINLYASKIGHDVLAKRLGTSVETIEIMVKGLTMKKGEDIRAKAGVNMFRKSLTSMNDLKPGVILTGVVRNITHFGAFVDVGVETSGLIHKSNMGITVLSVGQRVETKVVNVEKERGRIGLAFSRFV